MPDLALPWESKPTARPAAPAPTPTPARPQTAPSQAPRGKPTEPEPVTTWADLAKVIGPVRWDWEKWLAPGFVHLVASKSGLGKSTLAMRIAACYLRGDCWPDGTPFEGEPGAVLWLETENAQALNLGRAMKWGLPLDHLVNPFADPLAELRLADARHRRAIEQSAKRPDVRLVVLDSLSGGWAGRDENSADVLGLMKSFAGLARDTQKPFLVTHHLRKRGLQDVDGELDLDMLRGSSAVVQVARLVWALDRPSKTDTTLRLQVLKSNLARFPSPLGMAIDDDGGVTFASKAPAKMSKEQDAVEFLRHLLEPAPQPAARVWEQARTLGIAERTLERAKDILGVETKKSGAGWTWGLPSSEPAGFPGF